jgi:transcriptional regulator with XRE-family HTH domain
MPMAELKARQREWILALAQATGLSLTQVARRAGVHDSTLTRFANNPAFKHALSSRTIDQIAATFGVPFGQVPLAPGDMVQFVAQLELAGPDDEEAIAWPVDQVHDSWARQALATLPSDLEIWQLQSMSLSVLGYMPGDFLVVSRTAKAPPHGVVLVQFSPPGQRTRFAFRLLEPPFVVTASWEKGHAHPDLIDERTVRVIGTVRMTLRTYATDAAPPTM